jgi:citrate synthase
MADEPITPTATGTTPPVTAIEPVTPEPVTVDIMANPAVAKIVKELRDEAAKARIAGNTVKTEAEARMKAVAQALGLEGETPDPVKLAAERDASKAEVRQLRTEGKVRSLASKVSADAEALLDSRSFVQAIAALDPTAADFDTAVTAAMTAALASNPKLKIAAPGAARGSLEIAPTVEGKTFSRSQLKDSAFYAANEKDITAAFKAGRITQD